MEKPDFDEEFGNSRIKKPSSVTVPVNGQRVQSLRQSAGMTQEDLAQKAGYSDRLIRKAEASSPLRKSTVADLAVALSTATLIVTAEDLVFSREMISINIAAYLLHGSPTSTATNEDLIHPGFALHAAGQDLSIPFAGTYRGPTACESFRDQLRRSFQAIHYQPKQTRCFAADNETCVQAITQMHSLSKSSEQPLTIDIWWYLRTRFEASRLLSVELHYDTGNICRLLGSP